MSVITFKDDVNVFEDNEFVGRIESEDGFEPVFFPITEGHLSIDSMVVILDKLRELD